MLSTSMVQFENRNGQSLELLRQLPRETDLIFITSVFSGAILGFYVNIITGFLKLLIIYCVFFFSIIPRLDTDLTPFW